LRHAGATARGLATAIVRAVDRFTGGVREDDLTLLVVQRA